MIRMLVPATALAVAAPLTAPATAATVPAYGSITIVNTGLGWTVGWTYDDAFWGCSTTVAGQFSAPVSITVTCVPNQSAPAMACPVMLLTTWTDGSAARAGGRVRCTRTLDTGVISGENVAYRTGDLGPASAITCSAYVDDLVLVPPYQVTCNEPGLPSL